MDLITGRIEKVPLKNIVPLYHDNISNREMSKKREYLRDNCYLLTLEKDPVENKFWLVSGYPEYLIYKEFNENYDAVCFIRPYTNETMQRLSVLHTLFTYQTSTWFQKHIYIHKLVEDGYSSDRIADKMNVAKTIIENYLIHPDIPKNIVKKGFDNKASFPNLDRIRRLRMNKVVQSRLFEKAVLPRSSPDRLTTDKLQKVLWVYKNCRGFTWLNIDDQWQLIVNIMNYKEAMINNYSSMIEEMLNKTIIFDETYGPCSVQIQ